MQKSSVVSLKKIVLAHYQKHGRVTLPWRKNASSYRVVVSEYMLQQTQAARVIPKFNAFVKKFPNFKVLASASLPEVFTLWQGLGYNRRAKYLRDAARLVVTQKKGILPNDAAYLLTLPGVGPYTVGAIRAFAFGNPEPFVETNIRTVIMHYYFKGAAKVSDSEVLAQLQQLKPAKGEEAKEWYAALMDYGAFLKESGIRINSRSRHYTKQKAFKGSLREVRGALMREIGREPSAREDLFKKLSFEREKVNQALHALSKEGLVIDTKGKVRLTS